MDKKYQIFISSTYKDLIPEREKVRDVVLSMYHFPIGMEMFNAADEEQWEIIRETIDSSDYYVLILGKRYGSTIPPGKPDAGMSYTEKEFRYAVSRGIPVLAFIKKDSAVTADKMDTAPTLIAKLQALVNEITGSREADWFTNVDELGLKVTLALHKQMDRKKRPGWVRGDRIDVDASLNEIVVLNHRVRELEEENKRLQETAANRTPSLNVSMQYVGTVEAPIKVGEANLTEIDNANCELSMSETVQRKHVSENGYLVLTEPLSLDDVPDEVKGLVTQDAIRAYNDKLPKEKTIEEYNSGMRLFHEIQRNGQLMNFVISNDGTAKATDVNITLEFPDSFILFKRAEAERFSEPTPPKMPTNPIDEAMARRHMAGNALRQMIHMMGNSYAGLNFSKANPLDLDTAILGNDFTAGWSVEIESNNVKIWSRDILHTYSRIAEICFIPTKKGNYRIKVSMMCEEYIQPEDSELEVVVE